MSHLNEVELARLMMTAIGQLQTGERTIVEFTPLGDWTHADVVQHSQPYAPLGKRLIWTKSTEIIPEAEGRELWELTFQQMDTHDARVCTLAEAIANQRAMQTGTK
jgi:hypothetical protein